MSGSSGAPILEVKGVTIALPPGGDRATAVRNVSFTVGRGEILCLVGESGSGKSVIAQGVMGLLPKTLPVTTGQIVLQGEDITHAPLSRLRELRATRMSMIFQEPMTALNPVMTCGDQVDEVLREHTKLGVQIRHNARRLPLHGYPFDIVYRATQDSIVIVALTHQRRRPRYWMGRR